MVIVTRAGLIGVTIGVLFTLGGVPDFEAALSKLENWKPEYTAAQLEDWAAVIQQGTEVGDSGVLVRLQRVLENDKLHERVRRVALKLAIAKANEEAALRIVRMMAGWCDNGESGPDGNLVTQAQGLLIWTAVVEDLDRLEHLLSDQQAVLGLLVGATKLRHAELLGHVLPRIAASPAPLPQRQQATLSIIRHYKDWTTCPASLRRILGPEMIGALREEMRRASDAEDFNYQAASALAHLGDEEIVAELERWRPELATRDGVYAELVDGWLWMIAAQHPPAKLVDHVRVEGHRWAIERALQLSIGKEEIRAAVLEHMRQLRATGGAVEENMAVSLGRYALDLGVLRPEDVGGAAPPN